MSDGLINKFAFVILNYGAVQHAINCVSSIKEHLSDSGYEIVIVDNNSPDKSGKLIRDIYKEDKCIHVILNEENLGFAQGHNVGFRFAKHELGCDCIILLNNDTAILQDDFLEIIRKEYEVSGCDVMGPAIMHEGRMTDLNPGRDKPFNRRKLSMFISINRILLLLNRLYLDWLPEKIYETYVDKKKEKAAQTRTENVALYGCCLVLTPKFVNEREGLNPNTFMYMEEDILYEEVMKSGGRTVYLPELMIEHKEAVSTMNYLGDGHKQRGFKYIHTIGSAKVLKSIN